MPFSDDDLDAFYREIEARTDARGSSPGPVRRSVPPPPPPSRPDDPADESAFSDDDLEAFYRTIEARTAAQPARRSRRAPDRPATRSCPTPAKVAFADEHLARESIIAVRRHVGRRPSLRCYECVCGAWHITSSAQV
ncbi:hypothetical protein V1Y59_21775 [Gordonia sp. PKS22-38]|uniref:Uncharacterized protein n=1 Tax=Gordonia prachuapensis TaxID=3115651 RepID=A0ABU7N115_9ACTN|nr:hypothetical protein [Gordonia sp. PKS22-38]